MADSDPIDLSALVRHALGEVAPDVDVVHVDASADLHDDLGLDSLDTLNFAVALHEATGIDIPERDYPAISSVEACVAYLRDHGAA